MSEQKTLDEIRIRNVSLKHKKALEEIANSLGFTTLTAFFKKKICEWTGIPMEKVNIDIPLDKISEIRITNVPIDQHTTLQYIASNQGYNTVTEFMRVKISEIIKTASARDKQPPDE